MIGEDNVEKKTYLQRKISEYMTRAETLKSHIKEQQRKGEIIDKVHIIANGTNYSYDTIFGKYLNDDVKEVSLEEPYLREYYQVFGIASKLPVILFAIDHDSSTNIV